MIKLDSNFLKNLLISMWETARKHCLYAKVLSHPKVLMSHCFILKQPGCAYMSMNLVKHFPKCVHYPKVAEWHPRKILSSQFHLNKDCEHTESKRRGRQQYPSAYLPGLQKITSKGKNKTNYISSGQAHSIPFAVHLQAGCIIMVFWDLKKQMLYQMEEEWIPIL